VVRTNYLTGEMRKRCLALGADAIFEKSNELEAFLAYCLQTRRDESPQGLGSLRVLGTPVDASSAQITGGPASFTLIGAIGNFSSASSFRVRGQPVNAGGPGVVFVNGTASNMQEASSRPFEYRGVSISISVDSAADSVFGHADLFANDEFKARLLLGSASSRPEEVCDRLRCLAKAKVDLWATVGSAMVHAGKTKPRHACRELARDSLGSAGATCYSEQGARADGWSRA
jgi:hypothetical protein